MKKYIHNLNKGGDFANATDLHINYDLIGEWTRANFMMKSFPTRVAAAVNLANREMVRKYRKQVIRHINNQGAELGWPVSQSAKYQQFKARHTTETAPLKFFGVMVQNIKAYKHGSMGWAAGIKSDVTNPMMESIRKGRTLKPAEYAAVLEFGSDKMNIPARPLWNPSYRDIGGNKELIRLVRLHIRAKFPSTRLRLPSSIGRASGLSSM